MFVSEDFNWKVLENLKINLSDISDWINFEFEIKNDEIINYWFINNLIQLKKDMFR